MSDNNGIYAGSLPRILERHIDKTDGCWNWIAARSSGGYGRVSRWSNGRQHDIVAHRVVYEALVGHIPDGLTLDHLCRNRRCVNPSHLEPVTRGENVLRGETIASRNLAKTICVRGHSLSPENVYFQRSQPRMRRCRECNRMRNRVKATQGTR